MNKLKILFTFGTAKQFPFEGGYIIIRAKSTEEAFARFRKDYPDVNEGILNCAFYYVEGVDDKIINAIEHDKAQKCHRIIDVAREKYINFLEEEIEKHCDENKYCKVYWGYNECVPGNLIQEAFSDYQKDVFTSFECALTEKLSNICFDADFHLLDTIRNDVYIQGNDDILLEYRHTESFWDDLYEAGYQGIDCNLDDALRNTRIRVNVMFATDEERSQDMSSIISSYGIGTSRATMLNVSVLDNALTYFIHQQGHSVKEVYHFLYEDVAEPFGFATQVVSELENNDSESMSELTALIELSGRDIIDFFDELNNKKYYLKFGQKTKIGIFNEWSGTGSIFQLSLDMPFVVPTSFVRNVQIEEARDNNWGYTVDEVYGFINSAWQNTIGFTCEKPNLYQEDLEGVAKDLNKKYLM